MNKIYCLLLTLFILVACQSTSSSPNNEFNGIVTSASPEATEAGVEILQLGGNAVDAAVAVSFALGVTEPAMSGLGGGTQILLALPNEKPIAINGTTFSPALTPENATAQDLTYHRRSTIPSTVKTLEYVWKKFGSGKVSWEQLLQPAIRFAESGFVIGNFRHKVYKKYESSLKKSPHQTHFFLMADGNIPAPGDTLKQPVLAQTLKRLATHGADDFYNGEIAQLIAEDMQANGGWISLEDLNQFLEPKELTPVQIDFRGYKIYSQPPPCGGWTALLILNLLENNTPESLKSGSESRFQNLLKALHIAHKNRKDEPVEDMLDFSTIISQKTSKEYARSLLENYQTPAQTGHRETEEGETTHFSVIDKNGLAVAVTASINAYFGAAAASPKLGFLYNTYMNDFELGKPGHPFGIRPGAMAYSSMSPTMVQKDEETVLVIGSPGSARIISSVAQLTQLWIDSDLGMEKIVALPRMHSVNGKIYLENIENIPHSWLENLRQQGFQITFPSYDLEQNGLNAYFGGIHAIARENGKWIGVADPRRDGFAGAPENQD